MRAALPDRVALIDTFSEKDVTKLKTLGENLSRLLVVEPGSGSGNYALRIDAAHTGELHADLALQLYDALENEYDLSLSPGSANMPLICVEGSVRWSTPEIAQLRKFAGLKPSADATEVLGALSERYKLPKAWDYAAKLKVAPVRYQRERLGAPQNSSITLASDVNAQTVVELSRAQLPGIEVEDGLIRDYPNGNILAQVLGYMGRIPAEQADGYEAKGYDISSELVGRDGLEKQYEDLLRGKPKEVSVELTAAGRTVRETPKNEGAPGGDLHLTIDLDVQKRTESALAMTMSAIRDGSLGKAYESAEVGAAVALDIETGQVIAMASQPDYDPNVFAKGTLPKETWAKLSPRYLKPGTLFTDTDATLPRPMVNNAVTAVFPPGSTFKMAVGLAALSEGLTTSGELIDDLGRYTRYSEVNAPACWLYNESHALHGMVDMASALAVSCNYYFYTMGDRLGAQTIERYARLLGMGKRTGIDLPGESQGSVDSPQQQIQGLSNKLLAKLQTALPKLSKAELQSAADAMAEAGTREYVRERLNALGTDDPTLKTTLYALVDDYRYRPASVLSSAIGQGGHTTTVLQMAQYTAIIASGGAKPVPHLNKELAPAREHVDIRADVAAVLREGMEQCVESGTSRGAFSGTTLMAAGKTGSAQMTGKDACAWFVGYAPKDKPRIAVAVFIAQGGTGTYAAKVGREVLEACFEEGKGDAVGLENSLVGE